MTALLGVIWFMVALFAVLAPLAWVADHWPTGDEQAVEEHERRMRALGRRDG